MLATFAHKADSPTLVLVTPSLGRNSTGDHACAAAGTGSNGGRRPARPDSDKSTPESHLRDEFRRAADWRKVERGDEPVMSGEYDTTRWLFADQLGPHFDDGGPLLLIEARSVFERRIYHRQKAHLILSALHHRAEEEPERVSLIQSATYAEGVQIYRDSGHANLDAVAGTSRPARRLVESLGMSAIHPERGWFTSPGEFQAWVNGRGDKRLLMEDWYRGVRARHDVLMTDGKPEGGKWNFDHDNRLPPPKGETHLPLPPPWQPEEDDIDARVRQQLDEWEADGVRFLGNDGQRRFAVTRSEAVTALTDFLDNRLALFGALRRRRPMAGSLHGSLTAVGANEPRAAASRRGGCAGAGALAGGSSDPGQCRRIDPTDHRMAGIRLAFVLASG